MVWKAEMNLAGVRGFDPAAALASRFDYLRARLMQYLSLRPCLHQVELRRRIVALLDELAPQVLIASGTNSAQFVDLDAKRRGTRFWFDDAGTDHLRTARLLERERDPISRMRGRWGFWRLRRYERYICSRADGMVVVIPSEQVYLRRWNDEVILAPCGANLDHIEFHYTGDENNTLFFCGDLTYRPNEDAVVYFLEEIFPQVVARHPEVRFIVAGRYRGARLPEAVARFPQVELMGYVEDLNPQWRRASIFVNPMRTGRGFITKILDAFTAGLAVVSTDFLTADLGIVPGLHFLSAASAEEFAAAVCALLEQPERKRELVSEGRRFAETHTWEAALAPLRQVVCAGGGKGQG